MTCQVNSYLKKDNFIKQDDGSNACMIPEDFKLEPKQTALYYYQKLIDNKQYNNMMKQDNKDGTIKQAVSSHSHWEEIANDQVSQEILKDLVRKAKETCENNQMWGNTPSELISRIEDLIKFKKPLIPWSRVLKLFTASCSETEIDYTMRKRSKRFGTRPGIKKFEKLKLAIGIDTSGSISNEQPNLFLNEQP